MSLCNPSTGLPFPWAKDCGPLFLCFFWFHYLTAPHPALGFQELPIPLSLRDLIVIPKVSFVFFNLNPYHSLECFMIHVTLFSFPCLSLILQSLEAYSCGREVWQRPFPFRISNFDAFSLERQGFCWSLWHLILFCLCSLCVLCHTVYLHILLISGSGKPWTKKKMFWEEREPQLSHSGVSVRKGVSERWRKFWRSPYQITLCWLLRISH